MLNSCIRAKKIPIIGKSTRSFNTLCVAVYDDTFNGGLAELSRDSYLDRNSLEFACAVHFSSGIDCVAVIATSSGEVMMWIGLPPISNYPIRTTEHAGKYLLKKQTETA